jgi:hypothetical protein
MAAKEENEKAKFVRESVVKYFFDMSKSTFTVMVLGGMAALFGIVETNQVDSYWAIFWGVFLTVILFVIGLFISKRYIYEYIGFNFRRVLNSSIGLSCMALYPLGKEVV